MRNAFLVFLSFISIGCASIRPTVSVTNLCPNSVLIVRDARGSMRAGLSTAEQESIVMDEYPAQQLLTADLFRKGTREIIGHFKEVFSKEVYDPRRSRYGSDTIIGAEGVNGYDWSFGPSEDKKTCTENFNGAVNRGSSSSGSGSSGGSIRQHGPPAWP